MNDSYQSLTPRSTEILFFSILNRQRPDKAGSINNISAQQALNPQAIKMSTPSISPPDSLASGSPASARIQQQSEKVLELASKPTFLAWENMRFLIMDSPREHNLHLYLKEAKRHNVTDFVRVCEEMYPATEVEKAGINLHVSFCIWVGQYCVVPLDFKDAFLKVLTMKWNHLES